jgi:hypothetical protein
MNKKDVMKRKIIEFIRRLVGTQNIQDTMRKLQTILNAQLFRGIIEDSEWLRYKSFALGGWAMDNAALYTLFCILNQVKPKRILEFGLGQSSKMVHQYATFSKNVTALTVEHDKDWIQFFCCGMLKDVNLNIKQIDTEKVVVNGYETLSYKNVNTLFEGGGANMI